VARRVRLVRLQARDELGLHVLARGALGAGRGALGRMVVGAMTCYVDTVRHYPGAGLRFDEFCHLLADSPEELHAMADQIGMPRRFFQDHPWRWHYDLPAHLRAEAVGRGAEELTLHEVGALLRERRQAVHRYERQDQRRV
jgi:hypothetical protein